MSYTSKDQQSTAGLSHLCCNVFSWQPQSQSSWLDIFSGPSGSTPPEQGYAGGGMRGNGRCFLPSTWIHSLKKTTSGRWQPKSYRFSRFVIVWWPYSCWSDLWADQIWTYSVKPSHSIARSAWTGQLPPAGQSSPGPASCRSLLQGISAVHPKRTNQETPRCWKSS